MSSPNLPFLQSRDHMPLDADVYLKNRGWQGSGSGLRKGALSKPLAIPQKRNLGGLGKDRDEAYPFWDHLFTAASKTITIRIHTDDDSDVTSPPAVSPSPSPFQRTKTGILSSLRPSDATPYTSRSTSPTPRFTLIAMAKQEAARRQLYSLFYRGPNLLPEPAIPCATNHDPELEGSCSEEKQKKRRMERTEISHSCLDDAANDALPPAVILQSTGLANPTEEKLASANISTLNRKRRRKDRETKSDRKLKRETFDSGNPDGTAGRRKKEKRRNKYDSLAR